MIVDGGVDPVWAAQQAALGAFVNSGQICVAVERVVVHADVLEAFLEALVKEAEPGARQPADGSTRLGPLVDDGAVERARSGPRRPWAGAAC